MIDVREKARNIRETSKLRLSDLRNRPQALISACGGVLFPGAVNSKRGAHGKPGEVTKGGKNVRNSGDRSREKVNMGTGYGLRASMYVSAERYSGSGFRSFRGPKGATGEKKDRNQGRNNEAGTDGHEETSGMEASRAKPSDLMAQSPIAIYKQAIERNKTLGRPALFCPFLPRPNIAERLEEFRPTQTLGSSNASGQAAVGKSIISRDRFLNKEKSCLMMSSDPLQLSREPQLGRVPIA